MKNFSRQLFLINFLFLFTISSCKFSANNEVFSSNSGGTGTPPIVDTDKDGIIDSSDNCISVANANQADSDNDGVGNACDNCPNNVNANQVDSDNNGIGDVCEVVIPPPVDTDKDGVADTSDNCPLVSNANQVDSDNDKVGDACDNCPSNANANQADSDNDGIGDVCEPPDADKDGIADSADNCPNKANANQNDVDNDGVGDVCDNCPNKANSNQADSNSNGVGDVCEPPDADKDGIADSIDNCPNKANANQADSDNDKVGDACDNCPNKANANQADSNSNGVGDVCEIADADNDGVADSSDNCSMKSNANQADADNDGIGDVCDNCPNKANANQADSNNNGVGDVCEPVTTIPTVVAVGSGGFRYTSLDAFKTSIYKDYDLPGSLNLITPPNCVDPKATVINGECCYGDNLSCYSSNGHSDFHLRGVTFANGKFVAVGGAGHGISRVSTDGVNWTDRAHWVQSNNFVLGPAYLKAQWLTDVIYFKGKFVTAMGFNGTIFYSDDGVTWYSNSNLISGGVFRRIEMGTSGFLITGQKGMWGYSTDGKTWAGSGAISNALELWNAQAKGDMYLARQDFANGKTQIYKFDPSVSMSWVAVDPIPANVQNLLYVKHLGLFMAFGNNKVLYTSPNGYNWTSVANNNPTGLQITSKGVFYSNGIIYVQNYNWQSSASTVYSSTDGKTWKTLSDSTSQHIDDMVTGDL